MTVLATASTMKRGEASIDAPDAKYRLALLYRVLARWTAERARRVIHAVPAAGELVDSLEIEVALHRLSQVIRFALGIKGRLRAL